MIKAISTVEAKPTKSTSTKTFPILKDIENDKFVPSFAGKKPQKNSLFKRIQNAFLPPQQEVIKQYSNKAPTEFQMELSKAVKTHFNVDIPPQNFENIMTPEEFKEILPTLKQENFIFDDKYEDNTLYNIDLNNTTIFSNKRSETIQDILSKVEEQAKKYYEKTGKKFVIAFTDKDNIYGVRQIIRIIGENPEKYEHFKLLPATKFSYTHEAPTSKIGFENSELLAYGINPFSENVTNFLDTLIEKRQEMARSFVAEIGELYPDFKYDVEEFTDSYGLQYRKDYTVSNLYWRAREYAENKGGNEIRSIKADSEKIYKDATSVIDNLALTVSMPDEVDSIFGEEFDTNDENLNKTIKEVFNKYATHEDENGKIISPAESTFEELIDCLKQEKEKPVLAFASPYYLTHYFEEEDEPNSYENVLDFMQEEIEASEGMLSAFESLSPVYPQDKYLTVETIENFNKTIKDELNLYEFGGTFEIMGTPLNA